MRGTVWGQKIRWVAAVSGLGDDNVTKEERIERAEHAMSLLARLVVSLILPLWGIAMLAMGVYWRSGWWLGTGVVVGAIGLLMFVGSSLLDPLLRRG